MKTIITRTALALAASGLALSALPAVAADFHSEGFTAPLDDNWNRTRKRERDRADEQRYASAEPVYRDTRVWRGNDGRTYCRKRDGTTGLIVGGAANALVGREVDGGSTRTLGTVLGAAAGALLGRDLAGGTRCR